MTSLISKKIFSIFLFTYGFNATAADTQEHQISIDRLEQRKHVFQFQTPKEAKFVLVRSHIDDLPGFTLKDQAKDEDERLKFHNQFDIKAANKILTIYQKAEQWKVPSFGAYLFGL